MSSTLFDRVSALESGIEELKNGKADSENYGLARISESAAVTQKDLGLVLGAFEKNAAVPGSIMNKVSNIIKSKQIFLNSIRIDKQYDGNYHADFNGIFERNGIDHKKVVGISVTGFAGVVKDIPRVTYASSADAIQIWSRESQSVLNFNLEVKYIE